MFARDLPEEDEGAVRFVSGLATLPTWTRRLDGLGPDLAAALVFVALVLWLFWLW